MRTRLILLSLLALLLLPSAALAEPGTDTAYGVLHRQCPSVPMLYGFKRSASLRLLTRGASCAEALGIVRAMLSRAGVSFVGNPNGSASQFRWKLYGYPGWTCHGDGSGFPEGGAGGVCTKGGAVVEWYHEDASGSA